jgi:hypothetical protein
MDRIRIRIRIKVMRIRNPDIYIHCSELSSQQIKHFLIWVLLIFSELRAAGGKTEICDRGDGGIRPGVREDKR